MKTLIIGMGALGGLIAARIRAAGLPVWLATRDAERADRLRASGLRVTGVGGAVAVEATAIAPLESGITYSLLPAAWLGSTITGRWLNFLITGMEEISSEKRALSSNVLIPLSHKAMLLFPPASR